jgi:hypothetical protein
MIYLQFDNVHFRRDNPNVPSDLEQMPHLLNFIRDNGTLLTNDHTVLMAHTATGILSSLSGVYPDRMGQAVSNSFRYFTPTGTTRGGISFAYWTAPVFDRAAGQTNFTPTMINERGKIAPAPWEPFTRVGCDFGAVGMANVVLENERLDIRTVFGEASKEAQEVDTNPRQAFADYVGIAVHCAQGSAVCAKENGGVADTLPDEPGGYSGYNALFGAKYVDKALGFDPPMDLDGNVIRDSRGAVGFPGFDGTLPTVTLAWVATMQEAGIPVTIAYISDAHDDHGGAGGSHFAYGPGEAGYVEQLKRYDSAFQRFFSRLAARGITKDNTLFVFTTDEGDHFVGDPPTPANCDGVHTPCSYERVGQIDTSLRGLLQETVRNTTPFVVHASVAPNIYIEGNPPPTDQKVRELARDIGRLRVTNPYTGVLEPIAAALADRIEQKTLHLETADPFRTPTFTLFGNQNYFLFANSSGCGNGCARIPPRGPSSFAWSHGGIQEEIASTWVGYVGPGVQRLGIVSDVWTDHTDKRPTMLVLLRLADRYETDGRAIVELLQDAALPKTLQRASFVRLSKVYKELNAPFGRFSMNTLTASTRAMMSGSDADDSFYVSTSQAIAALTMKRDNLAKTIRTALNNAQFGVAQLNVQNAENWIVQAENLLNQAAALARP